MKKKYCKICHYVVFPDEIVVLEGIILDDVHKLCVKFLIKKEIDRQKRLLMARQYNLRYKLKNRLKRKLKSKTS